MSSSQWRALKKRVSRRDNACCYYCGNESEDGDPLQLDHKVPVAEGGSTRDLDNLGLIHAEPCHAEKSAQEAARGNDRRRGVCRRNHQVNR
ncbi:HNH endonuclease [Streptomyces sp. NPDC101733]|uniref:HNH endonuclease n=1 Tax=unclassified Streptomyces TaxID=2593676 RepID=UPI00380BEB58